MEGQANVVLDFPSSGIRGRVVLPPDEKAAFALEVVALAQEGVDGPRLAMWSAGASETRRSADVEDDGSFAFFCLEPGTYDLLAGRTGRSAEVFGSSIIGAAERRGLRVGRGEIVDGVVLEPSPAGTIEGRVLDAEGHPIPRALVYGRRPDGSRCLGEAVRTDDNGWFVARGLPVGPMLLAANAHHFASASPSKVVVRNDEDTNVELVLAPATQLHLRLEDGLDPTGLSVRIMDSQGFDRALDPELSEDSTSTVRTFGPLTAGNYRIELLRSGAKVFETTIELTGEPERTVHLH